MIHRGGPKGPKISRRKREDASAGINHVVMTTIFPPSKSVRAWARRPDLHVIVSGDKKTPADWSHAGVEFISAAGQEQMNCRLLGLLPYNHYCRKMAAYVRAIRLGAEHIVDTDDDNDPQAHWRIPEFNGQFDLTRGKDGYVNIYRAFTSHHIWPRGLPLDLVGYWRDKQVTTRRARATIGIWQGLVDKDPDVDAIYRLTDGRLCNFRKRAPIVLDAGTICPFNSQNTIFRRDVFALLYLPATVTFRFTDILRGFVAQPIMWAAGMRLGFTASTAVQERNVHNYMRDFDSEIPMYRQTRESVEIAKSATRPDKSVSENLHAVYVALAAAHIVTDDEIRYVEAWLDEIRPCGIR